MKDLRNSLVVRAAGVADHQILAEVLAGRSNIIQLTDSSHDAALRPDPPGGISHAERAALACRIARLNAEAVALSGVAVAHVEQRAWNADREVDGIARANVGGIQVTAVTAH